MQEWANLQIMECESNEGSSITVIKQSDGKRLRYVLGNGRPVNYNPDGTFTIPETSAVLSIMAV